MREGLPKRMSSTKTINWLSEQQQQSMEQASSSVSKHNVSNTIVITTDEYQQLQTQALQQQEQKEMNVSKQQQQRQHSLNSSSLVNTATSPFNIEKVRTAVKASTRPKMVTTTTTATSPIKKSPRKILVRNISPERPIRHTVQPVDSPPRVSNQSTLIGKRLIQSAKPKSRFSANKAGYRSCWMDMQTPYPNANVGSKTKATKAEIRKQQVRSSELAQPRQDYSKIPLPLPHSNPPKSPSKNPPHIGINPPTSSVGVKYNAMGSVPHSIRVTNVSVTKKNGFRRTVVPKRKKVVSVKKSRTIIRSSSNPKRRTTAKKTKKSTRLNQSVSSTSSNMKTNVSTRINRRIKQNIRQSHPRSGNSSLKRNPLVSSTQTTRTKTSTQFDDGFSVVSDTSNMEEMQKSHLRALHFENGETHQTPSQFNFVDIGSPTRSIRSGLTSIPPSSTNTMASRFKNVNAPVHNNVNDTKPNASIRGTKAVHIIPLDKSDHSQHPQTFNQRFNNNNNSNTTSASENQTVSHIYNIGKSTNSQLHNVGHVYHMGNNNNSNKSSIINNGKNNNNNNHIINDKHVNDDDATFHPPNMIRSEINQQHQYEQHHQRNEATFEDLNQHQYRDSDYDYRPADNKYKNTQYENEEEYSQGGNLEGSYIEEEDSQSYYEEQHSEGDGNESEHDEYYQIAHHNNHNEDFGMHYSPERKKKVSPLEFNDGFVPVDQLIHESTLNESAEKDITSKKAQSNTFLVIRDDGSVVEEHHINNSNAENYQHTPSSKEKLAKKLQESPFHTPTIAESEIEDKVLSDSITTRKTSLPNTDFSKELDFDENMETIPEENTPSVSDSSSSQPDRNESKLENSFHKLNNNDNDDHNVSIISESQWFSPQIVNDNLEKKDNENDEIVKKNEKLDYGSEHVTSIGETKHGHNDDDSNNEWFLPKTSRPGTMSSIASPKPITNEHWFEPAVSKLRNMTEKEEIIKANSDINSSDSIKNNNIINNSENHNKEKEESTDSNNHLKSAEKHQEFSENLSEVKNERETFISDGIELKWEPVDVVCEVKEAKIINSSTIPPPPPISEKPSHFPITNSPPKLPSRTVTMQSPPKKPTTNDNDHEHIMKRGGSRRSEAHHRQRENVFHPPSPQPTPAYALPKFPTSTSAVAPSSSSINNSFQNDTSIAAEITSLFNPSKKDDLQTQMNNFAEMIFNNDGSVKSQLQSLCCLPPLNASSSGLSVMNLDPNSHEYKLSVSVLQEACDPSIHVIRCMKLFNEQLFSKIDPSKTYRLLFMCHSTSEIKDAAKFGPSFCGNSPKNLYFSNKLDIERNNGAARALLCLTDVEAYDTGNLTRDSNLPMIQQTHSFDHVVRIFIDGESESMERYLVPCGGPSGKNNIVSFIPCYLFECQSDD
eukprot:TRINITY_DN4839_c0_g2_i4.p1 TRINITY_DN4839_c0_g2~~TRINITY_DN4839_c0_g2_i4.p1  ORF type:complete len:1483 (-),score=441.68 TRINITY_DN4839_c0_g2_i4:29-4198(-)